MVVTRWPKCSCLDLISNFNRNRENAMRKYIYTLLFISTALFSCKKDFLTIVPQSLATDAAFYKTTADLNNAVTASYAPLQNMYGGNFISFMEVRGDNVEDLNPGGNAGTDYNIDRFLAKSDNAYIATTWGNLYDAVSRCNTALSHLDVVDNAALKSQFEGELKFLRALHYFNIVRLWGAAPLIMKPVTANEAKTIGRSAPAELYSAIESDLNQAITLLPVTYGSTADLGRATRGAAKALLGKVFLTEQKYSEAVNTLKDLTPISGNAYNYALLTNVGDVFNVSNKMNAEVIFAVRYNKTIVGQGHGLSQYFNQPALDPKLLSDYGTTDTRRALLNTVTIDANNKPVSKYYDTYDPNTKTLGNDFIVLRYADVLLMYAEALNEVGYSAAAFDYLNAVRGRAKAALYTATELPDQATFRTAVLRERRLEMPLELQRWFDLVRTRTAIAALQNSGLTPISIQAYQYLYPVPQSEIDIMKNPAIFAQNPGY